MNGLLPTAIKRKSTYEIKDDFSSTQRILIPVIDQEIVASPKKTIMLSPKYLMSPTSRLSR